MKLQRCSFLLALLLCAGCAAPLPPVETPAPAQTARAAAATPAPTPSPTPTPTPFTPYLSYYSFPAHEEVRIDLSETEVLARLAAFYDRTLHEEREGDTVYTELPTGCAWPMITCAWAPHRQGSFGLDQNGQWFLSYQLADGRYLADQALFDDVIALIGQDTGCEIFLPCDMGNVQSAHLEMTADGETLLDKTISGAKAQKLGKVLAGAQPLSGAGVNQDFMPGPRLTLTRSDGTQILIALSLNGDQMVLAPIFGYDYGPGQDDATGALLSCFGLKAWPEDVLTWRDTPDRREHLSFSWR
ncbi:MAG: hypothetical protein PHD32_08550 [Eubacteriales bacterium]|nr:hypothetical protein [Eubacteriales bacterium]